MQLIYKQKKKILFLIKMLRNQGIKIPIWWKKKENINFRLVNNRTGVWHTQSSKFTHWRLRKLKIAYFIEYYTKKESLKRHCNI